MYVAFCIPTCVVFDFVASSIPICVVFLFIDFFFICVVLGRYCNCMVLGSMVVCVLPTYIY